jgi:predicted nicotinamide N-methyase
MMMRYSYQQQQQQQHPNNSNNSSMSNAEEGDEQDSDGFGSDEGIAETTYARNICLGMEPVASIASVVGTASVTVASSSSIASGIASSNASASASTRQGLPQSDDATVVVRNTTAAAPNIERVASVYGSPPSPALIRSSSSSSSARQEQRLEDIFNICADTNGQVQALVRNYERLSHTVAVLDERVARLMAANEPTPSVSPLLPLATTNSTFTVSDTVPTTSVGASSSWRSRPRSSLSATTNTTTNTNTTQTAEAGEDELEAAMACLATRVARLPIPMQSPPPPTATATATTYQRHYQKRTHQLAESTNVAVPVATTTAGSSAKPNTASSNYGSRKEATVGTDRMHEADDTASLTAEKSSNDDDDIDVDDDVDDDEDDDNVVDLWETEEQDMVEIRLPNNSDAIDGAASCSDNGSTSRATLQLRQYGSSDSKWGIHSTIWDGGLALAVYLADQYRYRQPNSNSSVSAHSWKGLTLIDLGSGTGLVGLAVSALSQGQAVVAVTDIQEAVPLLEQNVRLNSHHWTLAARSSESSLESTPSVVHEPVVHELTWGQPISDGWLEQVLVAVWDVPVDSVACASRNSRILLTGADIVYRPSLFQPLLSTLSELSARLHQLAPDATVECLFACQSRFTHLSDFWDAARRQNFGVDFLAQVRLGETVKTDLATAKIELVDLNRQQVQPPTGESRVGYNNNDNVWIVRIHKLPYTFSI